MKTKILIGLLIIIAYIVFIAITYWNCSKIISEACEINECDFSVSGFKIISDMKENCCGNKICEIGESYPECVDCPNCDDENECTIDSYDYHEQECVHELIIPCCGNGICDEETPETYLSCPTDCPNCDDDDRLTIDSFNYTTQKCENVKSGKGRVIFDLKVVPEEITTRKIVDNFLIGVSTGDPKIYSIEPTLNDLRIKGLNYFLPFTTWGWIEEKEGLYIWTPPLENIVHWAEETGAVQNGHMLIFFWDKGLVPEFVFNRHFDEQKEMLKNYIKATVNHFPEIEIWTLNEPIAQNCLGWSREQNYDIFVSASKWVHEVNPKAKVMVNMIPIRCNWGGLNYEPEEVMDDLLDRGLAADIIGMELYYWWAEEEVDINGYPTLDWVKSKVDIFRKYNLPIIISEVGVPGIMEGREQWDEQADWMEALFRFFHDDEDIIGATWFFVRDDKFMPYAGLANNDYTYRPVGERLIKLANEWNPSTTHKLNGQKYLDLDPGEYDVIVNQEVFRVNIIEGQTVMIR